MGLRSMLAAGAMGATVGGMGAVVGSVMQIGRAPPKSTIATAAAFMGTMFGVGTVVRGR